MERGSEIDRQDSAGAVTAPPQPLTEPELSLLGALDTLIDTPRQAKRLVNLYRMIRAVRDASEGSSFLGTEDSPGDYQAIIVLLGLLTADSRLLGTVLDSPTEPYGESAGGLARRPSDTPLSRFITDLAPHSTADGWFNPVGGSIPPEQIGEWRRLHRGLTRVTHLTALTDLTELQRWLPLVRRFSYVLPPSGGWPADPYSTE